MYEISRLPLEILNNQNGFKINETKSQYFIIKTNKFIQLIHLSLFIFQLF